MTDHMMYYGFRMTNSGNFSRLYSITIPISMCFDLFHVTYSNTIASPSETI